jgi:hypothetical protein
LVWRPLNADGKIRGNVAYVSYSVKPEDFWRAS